MTIHWNYTEDSQPLATFYAPGEGLLNALVDRSPGEGDGYFVVVGDGQATVTWDEEFATEEAAMRAVEAEYPDAR